MRVYFSSDASVTMLSYNSSVEVSVPCRHKLLKVLSIHPCLAHRRCFLWTCSWRGKCRKYTGGMQRWVRTGQWWAVREGSMEKVSFEMNFEDVMRS